MRSLLTLASVLTLCISCGTTKTKSEQKNNKDVVRIMIPKSGCYESISGKDTILLKIEKFPNVVTGVLKYNFYQKDKNAGTIEGKFEGDKLFALYTYKSEGKTSVREVAFLFKNNTVIEGIGELEEKNGILTFKNKESILFSKGIRFSIIDCVENENKFQLK